MLLYRFLISLFAAGVLVKALRRQGRAAVLARMGGGGPGDGVPRLWLHAASNGELASVRPVIAALRRARPDLRIVVTCNTETGVALARDFGLEAALAPLDLVWAVRRFVRGWGIIGQVTLESELWPNRLRQVPGPAIVLGGRLTERTARTWSRIPALAEAMLSRVDYLSAQDDRSLERFRALGLREAAAGPVVELKALYAPPEDAMPTLEFAAAYPRGSTWLAASTHKGEEEAVIAAHLMAREAEPGLRLILALRHPHRAGEVAAMLREAGLDYALRSRGDAPAEVLLVDTMGEMALWYQLAGRVFVGGTLTDRGGHTPFEPAHFEAAILHGPDVANFARPFARLLAAKAAREVGDSEELAQALTALSDPAKQRRAGAQAKAALAPEDQLDTLMQAILSRLPTPATTPQAP